MTSSNSESSNFFHPATGVLILLLDWVLFSGSVVSLGLSTFALSVVGFVVGTGGTLWIQGRYTADSRGPRLLKGFLAGVAVGIPLPIAGTAAGGAILALSGLDRFTGRSIESSDADRSLPDDDGASS